MKQKITSEETQIVAKILKKLEPGELPASIFYEIARLYVSCIIEIVPLYVNNGETQVLLLEREREDLIWGGKLHTPGTVLRANDKPNDFSSAFERILSKELKGIAVKGEPVFIHSLFHQVARGRELALVFYVELKTNEVQHIGNLHDVDNLPETIVDTQIDFIKAAAKTLKFQMYE